MSPNTQRGGAVRVFIRIASLSAFGLALVLARRPLLEWFGGAAASERHADASHAGEPHSDVDHYTCSMHPSVHAKTPGNCPICGMKLTPVLRARHDEAIVHIPSARQQLIGVRTAKVVLAAMHESLRAAGRITYDESSLVDVSLKVRGWIAKLLVDQTGQRVRKGQTLFTLSSPELANAQQDMLLALHAAPLAQGGAEPAASLATAARERLRLLDMSDAQIDAVAKSGTALPQVPFVAPASGVVLEKNVVAGSAVEPGTRLFRIAALDHIWIEADVYEADLPRVHVGQKASISLDYLPGRSFEAAVSYIYPALDAQTRAGRVRLELPNRQLDLRPGMYATVQLESDLGPRLQVPSSAVVYTGPRRLVFVDLGGGSFRVQEIRVGAEAGGMYEVLSGLHAGDVVVTSGVFLIAAEARISSAAEYWTPSDTAQQAGRL